MVAFWMTVTICAMAYSAIAINVGNSLTWVYVVTANFVYFHTITWKVLVSYDGVTRAGKHAEAFAKAFLANTLAFVRGGGRLGGPGGRRHRRSRSGSKLNLMSSRDFSLYFTLERCLDDPEAAVAFEGTIREAFDVIKVFSLI